MAKLMKSLKDKFTPHIVHDVHRQGSMLTILWVTSTLLAVGFGLALLCVYYRLLILQQAVMVLGAR